MRLQLSSASRDIRWPVCVVIVWLAVWVVAPNQAVAQVAAQAIEQESGQVADQVQAPPMEAAEPNGDRTATIDGPPPPVPPQVISRAGDGRTTVRAVRLPEGLVVDGRLDDPIYSTVPGITDFLQQEPMEGVVATEKTEVWIFFDDRNFYVSGRNWESRPDRMVANELRRDNRMIQQNENFSLVLDTFYDRRNGFFFQTNPLGAIRDGLITDERNANTDWNTVWDVRVHRSEQYWDVEMAIPFKSLRYRPGQAQVWGINIRRGSQWKNEDSFLSPIPRSVGFQAMWRMSDAATLVGIEVPGSSRNLEFKPYAISAATGVRGDADALQNDWAGDLGFDAKYGVTQGLTADFTVNTDFAQVEDDEQQVNLTRFSLFFPEKREFFLEGQGIFGFGGAASGRRGGFGGGGGGGETPILFFSRSIGLSSGEVVPIRAGTRLTGRAGAYTIGLLNIQTGEDQDLDAVGTNFSVVRLRRDLFRRSTIGMMATNRSVSLDGDGANRAYGVDANFRFFQNLSINSYYAKTDTPGLPGADESYQADIRNEGDRYGFTYEHLKVGKNFNPEIGFVRRDDFRKHRGELKFSPRPTSIQAVRRFEFQGNIDHITGVSSGILETRELQGRFQIEFENTDRFFLNFRDTYEFLPDEFEIADDVILPIGGYDFRNFTATYNFGPQRRVSGRITYGTGGFFSGDRTQLRYQGRVEVSPKLSLEPRIQLNWIDLPEGEFTTRLVSSRVTYTMSPRLFAGALIQYNSSSDSISTNVRLRWEYEPGSDLFVVYSEGRETDHRGFPLLANRGFVIKFTKLLRF